MVSKFEVSKLDALTYFPLFLKDEKVSVPVQKLAYFESIKKQIEDETWGTFRLQEDRLMIHPSFRPWHWGGELPNVAIEPGLYALYQSKSGFTQEKLKSLHARILDILSEEVKFTQKSLIALLRDENWNELEVRQELKKLITNGLVLEKSQQEE